MAAGQAGVSLHTMVVLQAYQADLLKELDHGEGLPSEAVKELHRATDLVLHVTKQTVCAISHLMAVITMVVTGRHLWLNLIGIKERDKTLLLDAQISPSALLNDTVNTIVDRYQEVKKQSAVFIKLIIHSIQEPAQFTAAPGQGPVIGEKSRRPICSLYSPHKFMGTA